MELIKVLSNPVRVQVMQYLQIHGEATTKQISEAITDVPAPTLYRHINALLKENVLLIKEERKVRGSLERLLIINDKLFTEIANNEIADTAYQFLMQLFTNFQKYSCKTDVDPQKDGLCLRTRMMALSDERYADFVKEIALTFDKYQQYEKEDHTKLRSISLVAVPVEAGNP